MTALLPLEMLNAGEWAEIAEVCGEPGMVGRLAELGLRTGCRIRVVQPGSPCLVQMNGCRLCVRSDQSMQILVRLVPGELAVRLALERC